MVKKRLKLKKKNFIIFCFLILLFIVFIISLINIVLWFFDSNKTKNIVKNLDDIVEVKKIEDDGNSELFSVENIDQNNPYWDYIKMNLIDVDFDELLKINEDTKGWIHVNGTNINYPFVQSKDNDYYLKRSFDKTKNNAGWVFLDFRNDKTNNKNTIIYAHGRTDSTMFGSLKNILKSNWLENKDNFVIKIATQEDSTLWQVFSVYKIKTTSDYIKTEFENDYEFLNFSKMLIERSAHNFNTNVLKDDRILTLSTCYNDYEKVVMHAKLIKRSQK